MSLLSATEYQQKVHSFQLPHLKVALKTLGKLTTANKPVLQARLLQAFHEDPHAACKAVQEVHVEGRKSGWYPNPSVPAPPVVPVAAHRTYAAAVAALRPPSAVAVAAAPRTPSVPTLPPYNKPTPKAAAIATSPPSLTPLGFSPPLQPLLVHQLEQLQIDSHQSLMDQCRIVGSLMVDKLVPRTNTLRTLALTEQERHGLFVAQPPTHHLKCRLVLYSAETRQLSLTNIWPAGCSLQINSQVLFDTNVTPAAMIRPVPSPLPLLDLMQLPQQLHPPGAAPSQYDVCFSAQRKAANVQWLVVLFTLRKRPQGEVLSELVRNSPGLSESTGRMLGTFDSEVACVDPVTIKLRDPVSMGLISIPVRSRVCSHLQCFDFATHLEINTKARNPKWKCPTCSKDASVRLLVVDQWFQSLLDSRNAQNMQRCFQVRVQPGKELEFIEDDEDEDDSEEEEEETVSRSAAKRFQPAVPSPVLPPPPAAAAAAATAATSRLGVSRDQPILLLDDDDDLF